MPPPPPPSSPDSQEPGRPLLAAIAAIAENRVIGRDGGLPWTLKDDLAHFKRTTMGRVMIMGRTTFDENGTPLPGRTSIVLTRNRDWSHPGVHVAHDPDDAIALAQALTSELLGPEALGDPDRCPIVIGGGIIYTHTLPRLDLLDLTHVHATVEGDTRFPELDPDEWGVVSRSEHPADERNQHAFAIVRYRRIGDPGPV